MFGHDTFYCLCGKYQRPRSNVRVKAKGQCQGQRSEGKVLSKKSNNHIRVYHGHPGLSEIGIE